MIKLFSNQLVRSQPLATKLLSAAVAQDKLLPAYLFTGRALDNKWEIAKELACYLNCSNTNKASEGSCNISLETTPEKWCLNCRWIYSNEHPQALLKLSGEGSKSGKIATEKAREFCQELAKASQYYRIVIVEEASQDIFHRPAANALLKTIEEPKPSILLLFFALAASDVLPTVVSRCQTIELVNSSLQESGIWSLTGKTVTINNSEDSTFSKLITEIGQTNQHKALVKSIDLAEQLQESLQDEEVGFDQIIDALIAKELQRLKQSLPNHPQLVSYAKDLLELAESIKTQNRHFVSKKATLESFAFTWHQLQNKYRHGLAHAA